ncbi:MAG: competence protein ComEC [Parcubacteria group bacterium Gr01-1014_38]|nr:MAG: competence protein ComEC [Parcubacteria group bacterium Gr01-1014_38]
MRFRLLLLLILLNGVAGAWVFLAQDDAKGTSLHVLDIGQGDSILLRSGDVDVLVDGGPDATVLQRLSEIRPVLDRKLDVLVLTHPQRDHLAGLLTVLEREDVGLVLLPELNSESELFRSFVSELKKRRVPVRFARTGQQLEGRSFTLTVLAPDSRLRELARKNLNNGSVVLRADVREGGGIEGRFSALLTGDIERPAELHLVQRWSPLLDVDVLKIPHHGSRTSTSERLLRAVTPQLALVSAGRKNQYGHPAPAVLARLKGTALLRTDLHGTISLTTRDSRLTLSCSLGCPRSKLAERPRAR